MILIILSCAWVAGIFLGSLVNIPPLFCLFSLVPLLLLAFPHINRKKVIITMLGILLVVLGSVYSFDYLYGVDERLARYYNDYDEADIRGTVASSPDVRDTSVRLTVNVKAIWLDTEWHNIEGKALVFVPRYPEYEYGDSILIRGKMETPPRLENFDYKGYLEHQGIYTVIYFPQIVVVDSDNGFVLLSWIYQLREDMARMLAEVLPEPQAALAQGILLGMRGNIPQGLNDDFARSGSSHLLAISGFNLAVMAGILLAVGIWIFGRRYYLYVWLALLAVWFYAVITGFNPPVLRAAIMVSLFLAAEALGRQRGAPAALALAAAVMIGVNPYILGDASFQLSFLAMVGLIFIQPLFSNLGRQIISNRLGEEGFWVSLSKLIVDTFGVTLAAIIMVWLVIAYYFSLFSLAGPLSTFLLTPVQPFIMVLGIIVAVFGFVSPWLAQIFGWLLWPFLTYMLALVQGISSFPLSSIDVTWVNPLFMILYYIIIVLLLWLVARYQRLRLINGASGVMRSGVSLSLGLSGGARWVIAPVLLVAILTSYAAFSMPDDKLRVSFLDVGEGDATIIQKGNTQVIIDGGPSPQAVMLALSKQMPFWDRKIELLILTHPHQDHLAGLVEVLRRYKVEKVIYPLTDYNSPAFEEWLRLIDEKDVESAIACVGQQINAGKETLIKVLHPPAELLAGTESTVDDNSVVVLVKSGEISFLLTGDIMHEAEWELIRDRADIACTVLKVAHHGSDTSSTLEFLRVASPLIAVISCGAENKFGHPNDVVMARLTEAIGADNIYRTDIDGTIIFITDGKRLWVKTER